ncbi:unnamed protein product [Brassica rapa]|uniref:DC1-like C-terminal domain-containing protein n=1 Tax=Brassica campestris TaxID=3711 RepID=A0A3P6BZL3_BRACM|nr:unnamed protein product [Brassica rapa]VDD06474.1 unnamed protein product [Brassica rapa]
MCSPTTGDGSSVTSPSVNTEGQNEHQRRVLHLFCLQAISLWFYVSMSLLWTFKMDAKCASFTEPFKHITHRCPLYLRLENHGYNTSSYLCCGCHQKYPTIVATCTTCEGFSFDFKCLNLPPVVRFKYDIHPLYLYFDTEHNKKQLLEKRQESYSWCDVCEEEIHENLLFYICFDCRISLYVKCILGNYPYMKPGHNIKVEDLNIQIASNTGACRPMCHNCHSLCRDKLVFKEEDLCFCSLQCIRYYL